MPNDELWPLPLPGTGDGSTEGESEANDGTPGAVGSEEKLRAASRRTPVSLRIATLLGQIRAASGHEDSGRRTLPSPLRKATLALAGVTNAWPSYPSPNYSSRQGAKPRLILFHTAEGALTRASLGAFFARPATGASSHVGIDDLGITRYVPCQYSAWTARNANPVSVQAELCAFSGWTPSEWGRHAGMLENAARWLAAESSEHGIPLVRLSPAQTVKGTGVATHHDITIGWKVGSHTDCGNSFPIDAVIARARQIIASQEDDMFEQGDREMLKRVNDELTKRIDSRVPGATTGDTLFGTALNADAAAFQANAYLRSDAFLDAVAEKVVTRLLAEELDVPTWVQETGDVKTMKVRVRETLQRAAEASPVRHLLMGKSTSQS